LTIDPGTYTLVIWVDDGLGPVSRWVPLNSDGRGLYGCQTVLEVGNDTQTDVTVVANLEPDGWNINCATGVATPGTDSAAAVAPPDFDESMFPEMTSMPPVSGVGDGQTVNVTVSDISGHAGDHLAGILYPGDDLPDLDRDAIGGFWSILEGNNATTTEIVRQPGDPRDPSVGLFPFVTDKALTIDPGTYTLVIWVDDGLGPVSRWVPLNSDGRGLYGCQTVLEVGNDTQTQVTVVANLEPDGWNINCTTGVATPGTDSAAAVTP
jgi:hypothetical protein